MGKLLEKIMFSSVKSRCVFNFIIITCIYRYYLKVETRKFTSHDRNKIMSILVIDPDDKYVFNYNHVIHYTWVQTSGYFFTLGKTPYDTLRIFTTNWYTKVVLYSLQKKPRCVYDLSARHDCKYQLHINLSDLFADTLLRTWPNPFAKRNL